MDSDEDAEGTTLPNTITRRTQTTGAEDGGDDRTGGTADTERSRINEDQSLKN